MVTVGAVSHSRAGKRLTGMTSLASIVYSVHNLESAKAIHIALLGTQPHTDSPYYVGFNVAGIEFGLTPHDGVTESMVAYISVSDIDAAVAELVAAGASIASEPKDVGGGTRIATVTDSDGITLGLITRS